MRTVNSISGFGWCTVTINCGSTSRGTAEPAANNTAPKLWINMFIWLTMQCNNMLMSMGNISPGTRFHTRIWINISSGCIIIMDFMLIFVVRWNIWLKYCLRLGCWLWAELLSNFRYLGWTFWLIGNFRSGLFSATPTPILKLHALFSTDWSPICLTMRFRWLSTRISLRTRGK